MTTTTKVHEIVHSNSMGATVRCVDCGGEFYISWDNPSSHAKKGVQCPHCAKGAE